MAQKIRPYAKNMVQSWRLCDKRRQMRPHLNSCTADNHHPTRSWPPTPALRAVRTTSGNDRDAVSVDVHWLAHVRACATASRASVPDGRHACFHARDQCDHECHLAVTWLSPGCHPSRSAVCWCRRPFPRLGARKAYPWAHMGPKGPQPPCRCTQTGSALSKHRPSRLGSFLALTLQTHGKAK